MSVEFPFGRAPRGCRALQFGWALLPLFLVAACGVGGALDEGTQKSAKPTTTNDTSGKKMPTSGQIVAPSNAIPNETGGFTVAGPGGFPASHAVFPQTTDLGGPVLTNAKIVTVTFAAGADTDRSLVERFDDQLGTSDWWKTVTDGYCSPEGSANCIGPATGGGHVVVSDTAPATFVDTSDPNGTSTVRTFIHQHVLNGDFPQPTPQTIYAIFPPHGTGVTLDGAPGCDSFGGYHYWVDATTRDGQLLRTQYVVIPNCGNGSEITVAAGHEIVEAAADPLPNVNTGYYMSDPAWLEMWNGGGEIADLCNSPPWLTEGGFQYTRSFSNKSAAAGHSPCVPAPAGVYFSAAPEKQIVDLAVGESTTLEVTAYSDAARQPWTLSAIDMAEQRNQSPFLELSFAGDATPQVNNGSKVQLTIKLLRAPTSGQYASYVLESHSGSTTNTWPAAIRLKK
jgi:hypothetical protein